RGSGTAPASLTASYLANSGASGRSGTVTIAEQSTTVNQAGQTPTICTFSASPSSVATIPVSGGSTTFTVSANPSGCSNDAWTASVSDASWMSVSLGSGTTATSVTASYLANTGASARSGMVTISGQSIAISQVGTIIPPAVAPASL